jgi:3-hydroxyisobutyrate dehydrogenase-like beta-hydroxyacid dehydrogenase
VGSGALAKLCVNLLVAAQISSLAEALVLAGKGGLSPEAMGPILRSSPLVSNLIDRKIGPMLSGDFAPAFPLKHLHKDLGLLSATAHDLGASLPATEAIQALFAAAQADGLGELDSAAVYRRLESMAGLETTGVPAGRKA